MPRNLRFGYLWCTFCGWFSVPGAYAFFFVTLLMFAILTCAGCGHNMLVENEAIGFVFRIPAGEANYMGIAIGSTKSVVACVRGGASFESTTSAGGGVLSGSGAENKITAFRSNLQFNEGNLREAFTNPDIPMEVKLRLADGVVEGSKAPKFPDAIVTTRDAVMQVGSEAVGSNATSVAGLKPTGIDNLVNNAPAIVDSITSPVTDTVHDLVNPLEGTVSSVTNVINSVNDTIAEVNSTVDHVDNAVNDTLNQAQKTLLYVLGGLAVAICLVIIFLTLHSIFKRPDPRDKKIHIRHSVDDDPTPPPSDTKGSAEEDDDEGEPEVVLDEDDDEPPSEPRPRKQETSSDEPPNNRWKKIKDTILIKLAPLLSALGSIPNQVLQRLAKVVLRAKKPEE